MTIRSVGELIELLQNGTINSDTVLFDVERDDFKKVSDIEELKNIKACEVDTFFHSKNDKSLLSGHTDKRMSVVPIHKNTVPAVFLILGMCFNLIFIIIKYLRSYPKIHYFKLILDISNDLTNSRIIFIGCFLTLLIVSSIRRRVLNLLSVTISFFIITSGLALLNVKVLPVEKVLSELYFAQKSREEIYNIVEAGLSGKVIEKKSYSNEEYGDFAEVLDAHNDVYVYLSSNRRILEDAVVKYNVRDWLSLNTISELKNIKIARAELIEFSKKLEEFQLNHQKAVKDYFYRIEASKISVLFKDKMFNRYENYIKDSLPELQQLYSTENDYLRKVDNTLQFLEEIQGNYIIEGDQVLFYKDKELNQYNLYLEEVYALAEKEKSLLDGIRQKTQVELVMMKQKNRNKFGTR